MPKDVWLSCVPLVRNPNTTWTLNGKLVPKVNGKGIGNPAILFSLTFCLRYKDALHYAKDGNFHLSHHKKKMDAQDPSFTDGAAYYPRNSDYDAYLKAMKGSSSAQEEVTPLLSQVLHTHV